MSRDNPHIKQRRRHKGTGGLYFRPHKRVWMATWKEGTRRRSKAFRFRRDAERWLRQVAPNHRQDVLDALRSVLWAELHARMRFKESKVVSTKSRTKG